MNALIRPAIQQDYNAVCALFAQGDQFHAQALSHIFQPIAGPARAPEFFADILASDDAAIFVAERQNAIIGIIHCVVRTTSTIIPIVVPRRYLNIESLVVDEHARQQGIGAVLVERVQHWACEKGIREIELNV